MPLAWAIGAVGLISGLAADDLRRIHMKITKIANSLSLSNGLQEPSFGYPCQQCGKETVIREVVPEYQTKVRGVAVTVENAGIGSCDKCGAEHFDPHETIRWRNLLEGKDAHNWQ
jgi:YgiT-type zinc finger domain-containing protein